VDIVQHGSEPESTRGPLAVVKSLGPGLISGASDNDPTTVATLAVIGAATVYRLSWLIIVVFFFLAGIQIISARIGVMAKEGLQQAVRSSYGRRWGWVLLVSVMMVNVITIGADLEGGAAALALLIPLSWQWFVLPFAVAMLALLIFGSYAGIERILKFVLLVFVAYVAAAIAAHPDWGAVLHATIVPEISTDHVYVQGGLALLGTTMTSYAYVWETIEEAEESSSESKPRRLRKLGLAQADAGIGMFAAVAIFWFILIATGATLGVHHEQVHTAQDAARALEPAAGPIASYLFAAGLLASAILAVPVLAASSAYMLAHELGWRRGLSQPVRVCPSFYGALAGMVLIGVGVSLIGISPIRLLYWSGIAGGLGTPISLVFLLKVGRDRRVMEDHPIGPWLLALGCLTTASIALVSLYFLYQQFGSVFS
jgi:Mn2+/Fe2+ NRAMP family transporter